MRSDQPPRIAKWLLLHFGSSPNNQSILGDLDERYREAHSDLWYWRQIVYALTAGLWSQVSTQKWWALRSIALGWICGFLTLPLIEGYVFLFLKDERFIRYNPHNWWTLGGSVAQYYDWWFVLIAPFAVNLLGGWLVARSHRRSQRAMVLVFFASRCAIVLPAVCFFLIGMFVERQYVPGLIKLVIANAVTLPGILLGGGMFNSRSVFAHSR
jgi:hypothetical protein